MPFMSFETFHMEPRNWVDIHDFVFLLDSIISLTSSMLAPITQKTIPLLIVAIASQSKFSINIFKINRIY